MRLAYLSRVIRSAPAVVRAVLALRPKGLPLPWVSAVINDMNILQARVLGRYLLLPDPEANPSAWSDFIQKFPWAWAGYVKELFYVESIADDNLSSTAPAPAATFVCAECNVAFVSAKALASHRRRKHNVFSSVKRFIGEDAKCPVCESVFPSRLRAIAHLSDKRRQKCSARLGEFAPLCDSEVERLDEIDRGRRRQAYRDGLTQPKAAGYSKDALGREKWSV